MITMDSTTKDYKIEGMPTVMGNYIITLFPEPKD